jgi:hypothetical protein
MRSPDTEALFGIKVLDLCRVVSGPFATMHLGDLGADVVKIEDPREGDESRRYGPPFVKGESAYFLSVNRNKRSCAIDLRSSAGREVVLALAGVADVAIDNFRPGTLDKLGLGDGVLRRKNPQIIQCSISDRRGWAGWLAERLVEHHCALGRHLHLPERGRARQYFLAQSGAGSRMRTVILSAVSIRRRCSCVPTRAASQRS